MALQTQQRVSTSTIPTTFFHPQHGQQTSNSSYFSAVSSPSPTKQWKRPQSTQLFRGQNYGMAKKQKEAEMHTQSGERMTALHSRLQQEAEKIRKWKNAMELDIKHKEKCLEEANCTTERQQKSLTEFQLNNESLLSQLTEEVANQKEIKTKINSTREMCTALKNHCITIDAALVKGQEDKENLFLLNQERLLKHQKLLEKYEQLEKGQVEWHAKYQDALAAERKQRSEVETKCTKLSEDLGVALNEICMLEKQSEKDKLFIVNLEDNLEATLNECDNLRTERATLHATVSKNEGDMEMFKGTIDSLALELTSSKECSTKLAMELEETKDDFKRNKDALSEKVTLLELSLTSKTCEWNEASKDMENMLAQMTDNFKDAMREKEDISEKLHTSEDSCQDLREELKSSRESCTALEFVNDQIKSHLLELNEVLARTKEELSQQITDKEKGLEKAERLISDVASQHECVRKCWLEKEKVMEAKLAILGKEKEKLTGEVLNLNNQLKESETKLLQGISINNDQEAKYEEHVSTLKSEISSVKDENITLISQVEILSKNKANLTAQCSDKDKLAIEKTELTALLETKTAEFCKLQDSLLKEKTEAAKQNEGFMLQIQRLVDEVAASKMKEIDDKQKHELELLKEKTEASKQNEGFMLQIQRLVDDVAASRMKEIDDKQKHELELAQVKEEMGVRIGELNSLINTIKKEAEVSKKEFIQGKKDCDREVQDLVAALDSYRSEHEKTVAGKDKTIDNLKQQIQQNEKTKEATENELKGYEGKVKQLQFEIDKKNEEMKELMHSMESMNQKVTECSDSAEVVSTTPSKKNTSKAVSRTLQHASKVIPKPSATSTTVGEVLNATHSSSCKVSSAAVKTLPLTTSTPLHSGHAFRTPAPPTPSRVYNYHIKATPQLKSKVAQSTPRYTGRKRMHSQYDHSDQNSCGRKGKSNISYGAGDEEAVFKKLKSQTPGVTIQRASSTTASSGSKSGKRGSGMKVNKDLSWFDLDSVYGFGMNDC